MTSRKQSIYDERRRQIIDGALKVFSNRGYAHATNKEIAAAAGIRSPGLIYHYFDDKANLLRAVLEEYAPPVQLVAHAEELLALEPRDALMRIGLAYVRLADDPKIGPAIKLIMAEGLRDPEFARTIGQAGPLRILQFLSTYLSGLTDRGVLRPIEPEIAARSFLGPFVLQLLARNVLRVPELMNVDSTALVTAHVDLFLRGLQPESESPS